MNDSTMDTSVKGWLKTLIIVAIPIVGLVMLFVYAFSNDTPSIKANWAKAMLIFLGIVLVLYLTFGPALMMTCYMLFS